MFLQETKSDLNMLNPAFSETDTKRLWVAL